MKAWGYAITLFQSEKLQISCIKSDTCTKNYKYVWITCMYYMYVLHVCITCMYYMYVLYVCTICMSCLYVLYVCITCMYSMYILYVYIIWKQMYVKLRGQVALQGQKSMEKHNLQIQGRMHIFGKMTLNRVLTLPDCRSRCQLSESGLRSQKGPLGVELWSFYCRKRVLVPMSYIMFL